MRRRYWLSIAGTMGVGKSTLAGLLNKHVPNSVILPEKYDRNPYLKDYYKDPATWAYLSQLWFLRTKAKQMKTVPQTLRRHIVIQDTPIHEDALSYAAALHAQGKISDENWEKYLQEFQRFAATFPHPTLLIYLSATAENAVWRIQHRGRDFEGNVDIEYIRLLDEYNKQWLAQYPWPVLQIVTDTLDLANNYHDQQLALRMIQDRLLMLFPPPKNPPPRNRNNGPRRRTFGKR